MKNNQLACLFVAVLLGTGPLFARQEAAAPKQPPLAVLATTYNSNAPGNLYGGNGLQSDPVSPSTGKVSSGQGFPGYFDGLAVHPNGKFVYVTDDLYGVIYGGAVDSVNGALTPIPAATYNPVGGAYAVGIESSGRFLYASSTSGSNAILLGAKIDPDTGLLTAIPGFPVTAGSPVSNGAIVGQIVSDPTGKFLYTIGLKITAWAINQTTGALTQTATIDFGIVEDRPTQLAVDPKGRYVFISTFNGLFGFYNDGKLTPVPGSPFYRGVVFGGAAFSGNGDFLYVADGDVGAFTFTPEGGLVPAPGSPFLCSCDQIIADASGNYLYAGGFDTLEAFRINATTGALSFINGAYPQGDHIALIPRTGSATATLQSLEITSPEGKLGTGSKQQFLARGKYSDGTTRFLTASAIWSTSNAVVATIGNEKAQHGLAKATAAGTTTITATFGGLTASAELNVQ